MFIMLDLILNLMHRASSSVYFNTWQVISILTDNLPFFTLQCGLLPAFTSTYISVYMSLG